MTTAHWRQLVTRDNGDYWREDIPVELYFFDGGFFAVPGQKPLRFDGNGGFVPNRRRKCLLAEALPVVA